MMQTVEHEVINNEIVKALTEGKTHKVIASELGVSTNKVCAIAKANNLEKTPKQSRYTKIEGRTLEDIRRANPYKVGDKIKIKTKIADEDGEKTAKCTVEQITDFAIYARDSKGMVHCKTFAEMGINEKVEEKVG